VVAKRLSREIVLKGVQHCVTLMMNEGVVVDSKVIVLSGFWVLLHKSNLGIATLSAKCTKWKIFPPLCFSSSVQLSTHKA
jgi:hypothetical protein